MKRKTRTALIYILLISVAAVTSVAFIGSALRPIITELAVANAELAAGEAISRAVEAVMTDSSNELMPDGLIAFEKDGEGRINAVKTNIVTANRLKALLSIRVLEAIRNTDTAVVSVPVGSLTGLELLVGRGPRIPVTLLPVGSVRTRLSSKLTDGGINQTLHRILLEITADISVLLPTYTAKTSVTVNVVLSETVIVGVVPEYFAEISIPIGED